VKQEYQHRAIEFWGDFVGLKSEDTSCPTITATTNETNSTVKSSRAWKQCKSKRSLE